MPKTAEGDVRRKLLARAKEINTQIDQHQDAIALLSQERREVLEELLGTGLNQTQVAAELGISRGRVSQLLTAGVRPERAFFGTGKVTVAIGGKQESGRADTKTQVVASSEAFSAYERLADLLRSLGLDAEAEIVPPPGLVQLNRPNLMVLCSPKLVPFVGQVLEADPYLAFGEDDTGWYLRDKSTQTVYRSPSDSGQPADYAYVGRLPRPDGKGTFLYAAGIHAPGTLGAVHYLEQNVGDLYREVKTRRWSALVTCHLNAKTKAITSTELLTPVYRHDS